MMVLMVIWVPCRTSDDIAQKNKSDCFSFGVTTRSLFTRSERAVVSSGLFLLFKLHVDPRHQSL